jgi:hypothetical protein
MGIFAGPGVIEDGLVLALDAANLKGYDKFENLWTYSEQFDNGAWGKNQVTVTANQGIAPDGTLTADLVTTNTVSAYNTLNQFPTLSTNTNYCYSVFVKLVSGSGTSSRVVFGAANSGVSPVYASWGLQLDTLAETSDGNTPTVKGYIPYPNGWYRLYMVINTSGQTNPSVGIRFGTGSADTVNTFYVWGAQLERGSSVTDYYPTTSTTKTRGTTWTDVSLGGGNNGTLVNGPTYDSSNGGSIVFDGVNDYVTSTSISSQFTSDITAEAWLYMSSYPSDWVRIIGTGGNGSNRTFGLWYNVGGRILWQRYGAVDPSIFPESPSLSIGTWYHIVATTSGSSHALYLNASSIGTATASGPWAASGENITIGFSGFHTYHNGRMSNVRLYNRALTATEIQKNFNAQRGRFGI